MTAETGLNGQIFNAFSGADITAIITYKTPSGATKQRVIGTLTSITVSVTREIAPIWTMNDATFRAVARGKRSIAGTMTFTVFDRDPLVRDLFSSDDLEPNGFQDATAQEVQAYFNGSNRLNTTDTLGLGTVEQSVAAANTLNRAIFQSKKRYADQLPPFDVTISMLNETGAASVAAIRQIYIVSQGVGVGINDLETDQVYSYIARYYEPLTPIGSNKTNGSGVYKLGTWNDR